jgi:tripartite-type tricarboxylate transporter receptor subunit TctC
MRRIVFFALALALCPLVHAQSYPSRPIRLVVGFAPGGAADTVSRAFQEPLTRALGQPIVVENRPGAGSSIAAEHVAKAAPDGYTVLIASPSSILVNPILTPKAGFEPQKDLIPISKVSSSPLILAVNPGVGVDSVKALIEHAKKHPGKLNFASSGNGSAPHLAAVLFQRLSGVEMVHVPYKGGAPALADVMAGQVIGMFGNLPEQLGAIKGGKTRALAVSTLARSPQLPEVPTVAESGFPGFEVTVWYGVCAQSSVPKPILAKLHATLLKTLSLPEMKARLAESTIDVSPTTPEEFAAFIRAEVEKWTRVVRDANIPKQ